MKRVLTVLISLCALMMHAQSVTLAWDASPSAGVGGYRIYYGLQAGSYLFWTNAGLVLTQTVVLPHPGRWYFAATAVCTNGIESAFSNEVQWEAKPGAPTVHDETWVRLTPVIERSTNLVDWSSVAGTPTWFRVTNAMEFFATRQLLIERVQQVRQP
jgi:hypothetical protein